MNMKKILLFALLGAVFSAAMADRPAIQTPSSGKIDRIYMYSPQMRDSVTVDVWLPEEYAGSPERRWPVLYMHDGQNLYDAATTWNRQSWEIDSVVSSLASRREIDVPIIVGVHSVADKRVGELMPQKAFKAHPELLDSMSAYFGGLEVCGDAYADFVVNTLRPEIDRRYRTLSDPDHTLVMGSSMGGLMSVYMLCEYPEVFGGAGCLSTHWIGRVEDAAKGDYRFAQAIYDYLEARLPRDRSHRLYFDRGTETIDAYYGYCDDRVIALVQALGFTRPDRLETYVDQGAAHEENAWRKRVSRPLRFLLPVRERPAD